MSKRVWNSFLIAFSMFSKVPMPQADWDKENMKYMMCFFPGIGVVIGLLAYGYGSLCVWADFGSLMRAVGFVVLPVAVTGGIHLDGFLDTIDALSSCQPKERKLAILKDSHAGAFAIIMGCIYFLLMLGAFSELSLHALPVLCVGYVVSRCCSGLALVFFPCANQKGSLGMFADAAQKRVVLIALLLWLVLSAVVAFWLNTGLSVLLFLTAVVAYGYYYYVAIKEFGGTTGDIAGFFVQVCELMFVYALMLGGKWL
ncbi:MAG: adenosylcobinamide-GDP ribazoletransferase [Lachnospiraceae bacterium]|jgi:adenosylcobinamide-GDP ribazoletransferase|nr:adenosylcobinamide-GDP ribazoletransferase [Lachnospiraceae bacterium]